jgi:hypothetical protein
MVQREVVTSDGSAFSLEGLSWSYNLNLEHTNAIDWLSVENDENEYEAIGAKDRFGRDDGGVYENSSVRHDTESSRRDWNHFYDLKAGYPMRYHPHYLLDWSGRKWVTYTIGGSHHGQCMARMNRITKEWYNSMERNFADAVSVPMGELYFATLSSATYSEAWTKVVNNAVDARKDNY